MISSTAVAIALAIALLLRPSRTIEPELPAPSHIPADVRAALQSKMQRHGADMRELIMHLVVLDNDGAARIAGRVYDESNLSGPSGTDRLGQILPPQFFALQARLKAEAKSIVEGAARGDANTQAEHFGSLMKTCIACHQTYLFDRPPAVVPAGDAGSGP